MAGRRYKDSPCIFCGKVFNNNQEHPLCGQCVDDIQLGRQRRREVDAIREAGDIKQVSLGNGWLYTDQKFMLDAHGSQYTEMKIALYEVVLQMAGYIAGEWNHGKWEGHKNIPHPSEVTLSYWHDHFSTNTSKKALVPTARVPLIEKFIDAIHRLISYEYARGQKDGDSFLKRMARGDIGIQDLNERNQRYG